MIKNIPAYCRLLAYRLFIVLVAFALCRVLFYLYNYHYFSTTPLRSISYYLLVGLRFDISAIILYNIPFIILSLLPFGAEDGVYRKHVLKSVYMVINSLIIFGQFGDIVFFNFVYKRSTADIFRYLTLGNDTADVMPTILKEYWYILFIWALLILLISYLYNLFPRKPIKPVSNEPRYRTYSVVAYTITAILLVLGYRGGWQLNSIDIVDAGEYGPAKDIPLIINTPFSLAKTFSDPPLREYHFLPSEQLPSVYSTSHKASGKALHKLNVVSIILESFSKEYIGALNKLNRTNTPFLDSLIGQSLVFDDAFSDGKKSIEGIPAVVAGLPSWMDEAFIISNFSGDSILSLANLLNKVGYRSAFFHGGNNGTMGFTSFCKTAGFDYYYGRTEYNNDSDYDGKWGIWDEPYLQYFAKTLDTIHPPFYAAIFTVSSHHPFAIPDKYSKRFPQKGEEMPILKCVRYSDMALREFFQTASKQPWFDSTLFVITADHTGPSAEPYFSNRLGMFEVPLLFYMHNSNLKGRSRMVAQQIDIMPSVLDYIHYPYPYFAFGKSVFDSNANNHYAVNYINDCYQIVKDPYCLQIEGKNATALYNYQKDSMLSKNLLNIETPVKDSLSRVLEAVMQTYSHDLIHDRLH
jgi:phosphoglycerol transferase MdoB-like AlkP superfamily enzyme